MTTLPPDAYTSRRLEHSSAQHLHLTSRRAFIGPIPEGWLKSHRKQWYRNYIPQSGSRAPTFTASHPIASADAAPAVGLNEHAVNGAIGDGGGALDHAAEAPRPSSQSAETNGLQAGDTAASTTSLLRSQGASAISNSPRHDGQDSEARQIPADSTQGGLLQNRRTDGLTQGPSKAATNLNLPGPKVHFTEAAKLQLRARAQRLAARGGNFHLRCKVKDGEMMKVDRMLVRMAITQQTLGPDYDERVSQSVETRSLDKWREFMVVCRRYVPKDEEDQGAKAILQLYKTRVIAASAEDVGKAKKRPQVEITLSPRTAKVNLFSSLDKTLCLWTRDGGRTTIYYLRPQSGATSVEWLTFLRGALGAKRAQTLQVNVPDLSVTLRLDDPFRTLEHSSILAQAAEGNDEALERAINDERGAAGAIVSRCMEMLKQSSEWADVMKVWGEYGHIGLAWKRYDRLEWVHGAVEQRMYGTIAMQRTHDLELRPKDHYPTTTKPRQATTKAKSDENGNIRGNKRVEDLEEPPPVEGFLIRLSSQKGQERRMGKMLFKRLYFTSQSQHLLFLRPARSAPPPPPRLKVTQNGNVPSTKDLVEGAPLTYDVDPYPLEFDGKHISWLDSGEGVRSTSEQEIHDKEAEAEADRSTKMLLACDGFINFCDVLRVRKMHKGATRADQNLQEGSDVEFDPAEAEAEFTQDSRQDDGATTEVEEDRVFELLMKNKLVIRLQSYNRHTRDEWMRRLRALIVYWTARAKADMEVFKSVREQNLEALQIDERAEAQVGSFAYKWEVSQSYASPVMYNMCGIARCRTIHLSGLLFRKPRKHTTFTRCHVILAHGHLLIFQETMRSRSGKKLESIHHERIAAISLKGCYLYSGLLTENDLLYQNQTFDSNTPGHNALPRIYLEDGWTSTDEDAMTTFVVWHAKSKSWFRSSKSVDDVRDKEASKARDAKWKRAKDEGAFNQGMMEKKLTRVSQLGAKGRSVVFKARSRAERDHWVMAVQVEIERLAAQEEAEGEEVRLIADSGKQRKGVAVQSG